MSDSAGVGRLLLGVEQLEDPLGRGDAGLEDVDHRRQLGERHRELAGVLDEGLDVADGQLPAGHPQRHRRPPPRRSSGCRGTSSPACIDARDELGPEAGLVEVLVHLPEPFLDLVLPTERLHHRVAGDRLLDQGVERAGVAPLVDEADLRAGRDELHHDQRHRDHEHRDRGQQRGDQEHHRSTRR